MNPKHAELFDASAQVDDATGCQEVGDRMTLQKTIEACIAKDIDTRAKRPPNDFHKEMVRLIEWEWKGKKRRTAFLVLVAMLDYSHNTAPTPLYPLCPFYDY